MADSDNERVSYINSQPYYERMNLYIVGFFKSRLRKDYWMMWQYLDQLYSEVCDHTKTEINDTVEKLLEINWKLLMQVDAIKNDNISDSLQSGAIRARENMIFASLRTAWKLLRKGISQAHLDVPKSPKKIYNTQAFIEELRQQEKEFEEDAKRMGITSYNEPIRRSQQE